MSVNRDLYNTIDWKDNGFFSWKGKTFTQVTSKIQQNKGTLTNIFKATPLRLHRREIASNTINTTACNPRTSLKIDELNRPNGYLISNTNTANIIKSVLDIQLTNDSSQYPNVSCSTNTNCFSQENSARMRVRSAGMNRKKYDSCTNSDAYNANTAQYLKSRNKSFEKNQFDYKSNDSVYKPSNKKFDYQGGVDAGSLINRVKYDALTSVGAKLPTTNGNKVANTLAYAVPKEGFIKKGGKPFPLLTRKMIDSCTLTCK